jgi:HK97 family phage prohead protease
MQHAALERRRETKFLAADIARVEADGTFSGYASIFSQRDLGNDIVVPGAFAKSLARRGASGIRMLYQHDPNEPIGVWTSIEEDSRGLHVVGKLTRSVERGREVHELMRAGAIDGLSIGFRTVRATAGKTPGKAAGARHILEADLWEISVVTFPMHPQARVHAVKSAGARRLPTEREFERWLRRDAGLTRSEARTVIAKGFSQLPRKRDAAGPSSRALSDRVLSAARALQTELQKGIRNGTRSQ